MLTTSNLTRDNYQQTRLFIDRVFAFNSVFSWPLGKYFLTKKHRPFTGYFPDLSASKRSKKNKRLSLHRIDFSLYKTVKSLCIVNLYLSLPPPVPTATHILAHPAAKYLSIRVCPKFAISHFAGHHVILKRQVQTWSHNSHNDHSTPLVNYGRLNNRLRN